ncbi:MAG: MerR family transcriptional regulator [Flavipsychrobacter sp.]
MEMKILTLFGEEVVPEKKPAAKKPAAKKKVVEEEVPQQEAKTNILEGWAGDKQYYTIGEVAKLFKVRTSNIRFWTKEFALKVRTTRKGDRLYTPDQVREIQTIYYLVKEKGYTINGAKGRLKSKKKIGTEHIELKESLQQLRNKLVQIKKRL